jgi:biopolymer transport protein ExbB/TolQ
MWLMVAIISFVTYRTFIGKYKGEIAELQELITAKDKLYNKLKNKNEYETSVLKETVREIRKRK